MVWFTSLCLCKPRCNLSDDQIYDIPVHGGITYCNRTSYFLYANFEGSKYFVGWDYAHGGDYRTSKFKDYYNEKVITKKYTYEEIMEDVKKAIDYLCELEKKIVWEKNLKLEITEVGVDY